MLKILIEKVQQMIFLYSAINEGWTVKKLILIINMNLNLDSKVKKTIFFLENFLDKFIDKNYSIDTIIKNLCRNIVIKLINNMV